jgi:hypothetical protein
MASRQRQGSAESGGRRLPRLIATAGLVLGLGLLLGACTKCDVWKWLPAGQTPHSCHDTPAPQ